VRVVAVVTGGVVTGTVVGVVRAAGGGQSADECQAEDYGEESAEQVL